MSDLDEKLRDILQDYHGDPDFLDANVQAVKQAFIDAGWKYNPIERVGFNTEAGSYSDRFPVVEPKTKTHFAATHNGKLYTVNGVDELVMHDGTKIKFDPGQEAE